MPPSQTRKTPAFRLEKPLDPTLPIPLYHQAYIVLKNWIVGGTVADGGQLPSEADLCDLLNVSRITIKRALSELAAEGLVSRHRGRGTVAKHPKSKGVMRASFGEMMRNLLDVGDTTDVQVLGTQSAVPPKDVVEELQLDHKAEAYQILRNRCVEGVPYVYTVSFIPADVAQTFPADGAHELSLLQLLIDAGHPPKEAYQRMTATAANGQVARALGLEVGAPVMKVVRVFKTRSMRPVQHTTMYFRPDRYEYTLVLPAEEVLD